jgi:arginyl-tRNA synthetase
LGNEIGDALLKAHPQLFVAYNVIKGFLNLTISDDYWRQFLKTIIIISNLVLDSPKIKR